jgi:hypothetical protein
MQTTTVIAETALPPARGATALRERRFFGGMAIALTAAVFAGFSRTYYFNDFAAAPFELTPLLHVHGAAFTAWMLLLMIQTLLVATRRVSVHRRLGIAGACLAVLVIVLGSAVAVTRVGDGTLLDHGAPPLVFMAVPLLGMVVFGALIGVALLLRGDAAAHKRLMLLATVELATAGVARLPVVETWAPIGFFAVSDLFVLAIVVYDLATNRRVHRATIWGGLFLVLSQPLRLAVGGSAAWLAFASWLTGVSAAA